MGPHLLGNIIVRAQQHPEPTVELGTDAGWVQLHTSWTP